MAMSPEMLASAVNGSLCPVALASHDDVVKDPALFFSTLKSFHFALHSNFQVPVIGGKVLNLHVLYVAVTRRGGYDKVVKEKKWREISSVLDLSPTTTSASYALRNHYLTLLHSYELLYFFRNQPSIHTHSEPCVQVEGTIEAKLECGYLVSVKTGNETLNGVLYHTVHSAEPSTAVVPHDQQGRRARRKRRWSDPARPKPNRSGYNFFFAERHSALKALFPNRGREYTKMIGDAWNDLSPEERVVYQNYGLEDKERYQKEMKEYKEKKMEQAVESS